MLSLVNYGSSDESDNEEEEVQRKTNPDECTKPSDTLSNVKKPPGPDIDDEVLEDYPANITSVKEKDTIEKSNDEEKLISSLPAPISTVQDVNWEQLSKLRFKSGSIKILAPPLPKDEEPPKKEKKLPSEKGSGLLALLPKPKNDTTSSFLTPRAVLSKTNPTPKPKTLYPSNLKKKSAVSAKPSSDSEDEEAGGDFFSLSSANEPIPIDENLKLKFPEPENLISSSMAEVGVSVGTVSESPPEQIDFIPVNDQDLELDEEALKQLCGSRGLKRKADELRMIDIDGAQMIPDAQAMLTKNLTADMPRPVRAKGLGVTSQQKRKHQITYLAQQAKEQELELQNTWASNRMSRKQTQAKYGF